MVSKEYKATDFDVAAPGILKHKIRQPVTSGIKDMTDCI